MSNSLVQKRLRLLDSFFKDNAGKSYLMEVWYHEIMRPAASTAELSGSAKQVKYVAHILDTLFEQLVSGDLQRLSPTSFVVIGWEYFSDDTVDQALITDIYGLIDEIGEFYGRLLLGQRTEVATNFSVGCDMAIQAAVLNNKLEFFQKSLKNYHERMVINHKVELFSPLMVFRRLDDDLS